MNAKMKISILNLMLALTMLLVNQSYAQEDHPEARKLAIIAPNDVICNNAGGVWNECGSGCGPADCTTYLNPPDACPAICIAQCECPPQTIWQERAGCVDVALACQMISPMDLCANTSGIWNECGSGCGPSTCDFMPSADTICPDVCDAHCDCPAGFVWDTLAGCMPSDVCGIAPPPPLPTTPEELCIATQGTVGCQPSNCTTDENGQQICTSDCGFLCICPEGQIFDQILGCMADQTMHNMHALCAETGGMIGCKPCETEPCDAVCEEICICPEGLQYDQSQGCHLGNMDPLPPPSPETDQMLCQAANGVWNECASACAPDACAIVNQASGQAAPQAPDAGLDCIAVCEITCECPAGQYWVSGMGCLACENGADMGVDEENQDMSIEGNLDVGLNENTDDQGVIDSDTENNATSGSEGSNGCQSNQQSSSILILVSMLLVLMRRRMN
jgi:hypothetical protein